MKAALYLLFLTVGCTVWTCGARYATADEAKPQEHARPADQQRGNRRPPRKKLQHGAVAPAKANNPRPSNDRAAFMAGRITDAPPSDSIRPAAVASGAQAKNQAVAAGRPVQLQAVSRPSATLLSEARHRSPNPATVGGPKSVTAASSGAINGSRVARKP